ncbi:hypothetical protein [Paractinoplanes maris]|uniref:hypothetical protein n=1 Tax=Paractinoplanes maris TaxID=1734446 RepID=UPI0020208ADF|nr:hypothetical protein [Actinoplanes maris]
MSHSSKAGSETEQHITGSPETGEFITDAPPSAGTPASGSSNKGINDNRGNLGEGEPDESGDVPEPPD